MGTRSGFAPDPTKIFFEKKVLDSKKLLMAKTAFWAEEDFGFPREKHR